MRRQPSRDLPPILASISATRRFNSETVCSRALALMAGSLPQATIRFNPAVGLFRSCLTLCYCVLKNPPSFLMRVGWRSLRRALASIWRMRSRGTWNWRLTSSRCAAVAAAQGRSVVRGRRARVRSGYPVTSFNLVAQEIACGVRSMGLAEALSSMKSPNSVSPSPSPILVWRETGCWLMRSTARTRSTGR